MVPSGSVYTTPLLNEVELDHVMQLMHNTAMMHVAAVHMGTNAVGQAPHVQD